MFFDSLCLFILITFFSWYSSISSVLLVLVALLFVLYLIWFCKVLKKQTRGGGRAHIHGSKQFSSFTKADYISKPMASSNKSVFVSSYDYRQTTYVYIQNTLAFQYPRMVNEINMWTYMLNRCPFWHHHSNFSYTCYFYCLDLAVVSRSKHWSTALSHCRGCKQL